MTSDGTASWVCTVCGYVHEGPEPPETCPQCGAPASVFETSGGESPESSAAEALSVRWVCTVCGYVHEGPEPPDACPVCGVPASSFERQETEAPAVVEGTASTKRTVSDLLAETMVNWGVKHVFGMVGHSNLGMADALRRQEKKGALTFIGVRHEGAASFAASAYAKLTGNPAACLSIAGPGATNLLTGLWDAKVDRAPVLALTGQVQTQVLGPGAFQELDLASAFKAVAAWSQTVLPTSKHAELMTLALKHATLKRDVAHLILPDEVQTMAVDEDAPVSGPQGRTTSQAITPPAESVEEALRVLHDAKRPAIIVGHGARCHMTEIVSLAEALNCPVLTTFKGKGQIPDDHPLACGVLGRSGTMVSGHFMGEADLLVVFGASFSNHTGILPDKPTIQVDFDPLALGKFHSVTVPVYGEIGITARILLEGLNKAKKGAWEDQREAIAAKWREWRTEKQRRETEDRGKGIGGAALFAALTRCLPDNAVLAIDVGDNAYSFGRYFECKHQSVLLSGYLGSIGFGYPAAMGAWAAAPDRPIVAITGDGGFGQYMAELCTAVKYGMNITHVLLNNNELGKISREQRLEDFEVWQTSLHNPDFAQYAQICGAFGRRVTDRAELDSVLTEALQHKGPALVEVMTDAELV